jgi:hypothetical protein
MTTTSFEDARPYLMHTWGHSRWHPLSYYWNRDSVLKVCTFSDKVIRFP